MLRWRLLLGAIFIAALIGVVALDARTPGAWLLGLAMVVGLAAANELVGLYAMAGQRPSAGVIYIGTLLVIGSNAVPLFWLPTPEGQPLGRLAWPLMAFAGSVLLAFIDAMGRYRQPGGSIVNVALTVLAVAYVGVLLSFAIELRMLGGPSAGMLGLVSMLVVVKFGDIGAYTVGRLVGRHKMAPRISPGKTMEGAAGAIVFACLGAWLTQSGLPSLGAVAMQDARHWLVFGVAVGLAGLLGDLAESLLKRDVGAKDSSTWLPGFGGVLDLLDSVLFASPVAYVCWYWEVF